jgi:hypothetical protein
MESVNFNGGIIGVTMDFGATSQYVVGTTQVPGTISYVGGRTQNVTTTGAITVSLTGLTGGLSTAPIAGDLVLVVRHWAVNSDQTFTTSSGGWTKLVDLYTSSTIHSNFGIFYKVMGVAPDTSIVLNGNGSTIESSSIVVQVFRGVDATSPFDVASTTASGTGTIPNPPAITPTTANSIIVVAAGTSHNGGVDTFTASYLSNFRTVGTDSSSFDSTAGVGWVAWTSGAYDPAAWTHSQLTSATYSNISVTMALRAASISTPVFGNKKNSGIWNLQAVYGTIYVPPGQQLFTTSQSFVVPGGITQISAAAIGGGGGGSGGDGGRGEPNQGGGGGGLAYGTFAVTPGETLTITVGAGGTSPTGGSGGAGGASSIARGATVLLSGGGGAGGVERTINTAAGGTSTGTERAGGGIGGAGGTGTAASGGTGGGGAGGYSAAGGAGGAITAAGAASTGGGGGGGGGRSGTTAGNAGSGGGTGLLGAGSNGTAGTSNGGGGGGGSGGTAGATNASSPSGGGVYGGGGGGRTDSSGTGALGGAGAVRIIWGAGRQYPSTNTGDQ